MRRMAVFATLASGLLASGCSVLGIRDTPEPRYAVVETLGPVEIRRYETRIAAETVLDSDEESARGAGFRRLAGYIFGGNRARASIAMTAPVAQSRTIAMTAPVAQSRDGGGRWVVRFFMPAEWTLETLPAPNDPTVSLVAVPPETYAVLRFTGSTSPEAVGARRTELVAALAQTRWQVEGEPIAWFYDPPWTLPFLRRNEAAVVVAQRP